MSDDYLPPHKRWIDQCAAPRKIRLRFGVTPALDYLIGEKLVRFTKLAVEHSDFAKELPTFAAETRTVFTTQELWNYIRTIKRPKDRILLRSLDVFLY